jgi:hypothetical protein
MSVHDIAPETSVGCGAGPLSLGDRPPGGLGRSVHDIGASVATDASVA